MATRQPPAPAKRLVWRMDAHNPAGALVSADEPHARAAPAATPEDPVQAQGWQDSSLALRDGLQVSEAPLDSLPGELTDLFFPPTGRA